MPIDVPTEDGSRNKYADGTNLRCLSNNTVDDCDPARSPTARKIAFGSTRGGEFDTYVMDTDPSIKDATNHPTSWNVGVLGGWVSCLSLRQFCASM